MHSQALLLKASNGDYMPDGITQTDKYEQYIDALQTALNLFI